MTKSARSQNPSLSRYGAVGLCDGALRMKVGEQREMNVPLLGERFMTPGRNHGDAEELRIVVAKLRQDLIVDRHLIAADRAPVGGIKGEDHRLALEVAQAQLLVWRDVQRKIGSFLPGP